MEHIIDNVPTIASESSAAAESTNYNNQNKTQNNQIITREERETSLFNNYKRAFGKTLENLNVIRNENNKDNNAENLSVIEDDNISVTSSKILSVGNKNYKNSKLPLIYGTQEFNSAKYLGLVDETNQSVVNNENSSTVDKLNLIDKNINLASAENFNSRSQSNVYNNYANYNNNNNDAISNPINPAQNQSNYTGYNNNNNINYRNYDKNYDYNNSRPSMVSEFARPNFQQLLDQEIALGLNKKTSMEFNLQNNNNNVNFMRNQSLLITNNNTNNNPNNSLIVNFTQAESTVNNQTNIAKNIRPVNIKGKAPPKAPPLPAIIQQSLKKIAPPKVPSQSAINTQNTNSSVKLIQIPNSALIRNPDLNNENNNANYSNGNGNASDALGAIAQENVNKPLSYKENLSLMLGNRSGKPLVMPPRNSTLENNNNEINERVNFINENNNNNNFNQNNQNYNNNLATVSNESVGFRSNENRNLLANNNLFNNKIQLPSNNSLEKQKTITLGNFVRKSTLFELEEDDEEDNTGLFRRGTTNNINLNLNKKNTQTNLNIPEEIANNESSNTYEEKSNNSNFNNKLNKSNNSFNNNTNNLINDKKLNLFSEKNSNKNNNKLQISSQRSILKTKGLEKAKSTLNSMFAEENEDKGNLNEEETAISINKKTVDITKRLSNIFNLDEDNDIPIINNKPIVKIPEQKTNKSSENNKLENPKLNNNLKENLIEPNTKILIQPKDNKPKETIILNSVSSSNNNNNANKMITKPSFDPIKVEKNSIKPDLNKLNKLFLAEEEDEMDFKNINFKKEEKKILNSHAKDVPQSSKIVENIENLTSLRNEKFKNEENNLLVNENLSKDKNENEKPNVHGGNKNVSSSTINYNNSSNDKTNTSSENHTKNKIGNVDPLTGDPIPIKKESGNKKNSIKTISDPLSMIKSSMQNKNKNDPLSSIPSKTKITEDKKDENPTGTINLNKNNNIIINNEGNSNQDFLKEEKIESLIPDKIEDLKEIKSASNVSNISKIMSARMIFPGFPPQKMNDDSEFRPETLINKGKQESLNLNLVTNDISKSNNLSEEEDEKLNKIILDRPIVKNKKKQKIKKIVLNDPVSQIEERSSEDKIILLKDSIKIENEIYIVNKIIEEKKTERSNVNDKERNSQITELNDDKIKIDLNILNPKEEIKTDNEPNFNISAKNVDNLNSKPKKEDMDLIEPLRIISKNTTSDTKENENKIQNKNKKFNFFNDEEPEKDKTEDLFKLPVKRNTKIISFLNDDEADDPLTTLTKNKTLATKQEKTLKKKDMSEKLKFILDD